MHGGGEVGRSGGEVLLPEEGAQGSAIPAPDLSLARTSPRRAAHGLVVLDVPEHAARPRQQRGRDRGIAEPAVVFQGEPVEWDACLAQDCGKRKRAQAGAPFEDAEAAPPPADASVEEYGFDQVPVPNAPQGIRTEPAT